MRTKISLLTLTSFLFIANVLRAQSWTPASPNIYFTGGNVGIGTTAPGQILESSAASTSIQLRLRRTGSDVGFADIGVDASRGLNFWPDGYGTTSTTPKIVFAAGGNVGIGTTSPLAKLHLHSGTGDGDTYNTVFALSRTSITGNIEVAKLVLDDMDTNYGNLVFKVKTTASSAENPTYYTDAMTIQGNSGNVGIGTVAPTSKLTIAGTGQIFNWTSGGTSTQYLRMVNTGADGIFGINRSTTNGILVGDLAYATVLGTVNATALQFGTNNSVNITILSGGNVGIGTTSPLAKLHLNNGSVLFDGTTGATPTSGAGTRMMWIPASSAFRAGYAVATEWDNANIGLYSVALGYATTASATHSSAFGYGTLASAQYSMASGFSTIASGIYSTVYGYATTAQSYGSFVIGRYNVISGTSTWVATEPLFVIGNGSSTSVRSNALTVLKNGNVLISKTTQLNSLYKLDIDGTMRVNEIVVNLTGADFVFNSNYKLLPLNELELFIQENNHLPEIASAEEMETGDGVKIGEMQTKLLQKIEELTLYMIELNKTVDNLTLENKILKTKFDIK